MFWKYWKVVRWWKFHLDFNKLKFRFYSGHRRLCGRGGQWVCDSWQCGHHEMRNSVICLWFHIRWYVDWFGWWFLLSKRSKLRYMCHDQQNPKCFSHSCIPMVSIIMISRTLNGFHLNTEKCSSPCHTNTQTYTHKHNIHTCHPASHLKRTQLSSSLHL